MKCKISNFLNLFFNSLYLPLFISVATIITWNFNLLWLIIIINSIFIIGVVKFDSNRLIGILIVFSIMTGFKKDLYDSKSMMSIISYVTLSISVIYLFFDFFKQRKVIYFKNIVVYSFGAFIISTLISLINTPVLGISLFDIMLFVLMFIIMLYIFSTTTYTQENKEYLVHLMIFISFIIIGQMILKYYEIFDPNDPFLVIKRKSLILHWAIGNRYSSLLSISLLSSFYFYINNENIKKKIMYGIVITIIALAILICLSRGAILGLGCASILLFPSIIYYSRNKFKSVIHLMILFSLSSVIVLLLYNSSGVFKELFQVLLKTDYTDGNGRAPLIDLAWNQFKDNIFIGNGFNTSEYYINTVLNSNLKNYHNFILQLLAEQGILGLLTFSLFLISIGITCFKKDVLMTLFLCITIYMAAHGMVDTTFHAVILLIVYIPFLGFILTASKSDVEIL